MSAVQQLHMTGPKPGLDPYGHLLRMLVPRAVGIAFYDATGAPIWASPGYDGPDPQQLVEEALASAAPARTGQIDGFMRDFEGSPAYAFRLRDDNGIIIAIAVLLTRDGENRPYSFVHNMVQPALECLQRDLLARASLGLLARNLQTRDEDLDLLLKVAPQDPQNPQQADELGLLMQTCVDHLGCILGALVVPERNIALCKARADTKPQVSILTATHRHLLNWAQLKRSNLVINKVDGTASGLPPFRILCIPVLHASGRVIGFLALFRSAEGAEFDLRSERLVELLARKVTGILQTNFDSATSLLSRPAFEVQVNAVLAGAGSTGASCVLYIDVDRMHVINDNFGMDVGDTVIVNIAEVLRRRPRSGALAARVAGDRFALFLPDCKLDAATEIAENICRQCAELTCARGDGTVQVSVSLGVAELQDGHGSLAHGLAGAEIACKAAKDRGRGRVEAFQDADQSIMQRHSDVVVVQRVHEALEHDRFVLYAQPIVPLSSGSDEIRFELLLRMLTERGEIVPPDKFLSAAERYQLLPRIDRWVVNHALAVLKSQRRALSDRSIGFSINVSGPSVGDAAFVDFLEGAVRDSGLPPAMLCFELTETAAVSNLPRADRLMQRMRTLGCSFALDDFGTGLSSLSYLRSLPISVLKIDGSFVRDAAANPRTESMVRAIAQLAQTMGMQTVAEFVETDELRVRMAALGVDYGQGYAIGRPQPLAEVLGDLALYEMMAEQRA